METDVKAQFIAELKKAGFQTEYDHGVPCVLVGDVADLHPTAKKVDKIAKKMGYDASRGVVVKRGASVKDVTVDDTPDAPEEAPAEEPTAEDTVGSAEGFSEEPAEESGDDFFADESGQLSLF